MKRDDNKKSPSSRLNSGAEGGFDSEGAAAALYDELAVNELGEELYGQQAEREGFEPEDGQSAEVTDPFYDFPPEVIRKIARELESPGLLSVLEASPAWRDNVASENLLDGLVLHQLDGVVTMQDVMDYIKNAERGIALPARDRTPFSSYKQHRRQAILRIQSSDELRQLVDIIKKGSVFPSGRSGEKKSFLDFLGDRPVIRLANWEEYKKSPNPHDVFRDVCKSFGVIKDAVESGVKDRSRKSQHEAEEALPRLQLDYAYYLPDLYGDKGFEFVLKERINTLFIPWSSRMTEVDARERALLREIDHVHNIATTPITVDIQAEDGADPKKAPSTASVEAQRRLKSVLDFVKMFRPWVAGRDYFGTCPNLVIDPTVVYRDRRSGRNKVIDIDTKRETLINFIKGYAIQSKDFKDTPILVLPPRGPKEVPISDGGLATNGEVKAEELPLACAEKWKEFKNLLERTRSHYTGHDRDDIFFDQGFPPGIRGKVNFPYRGGEVRLDKGRGFRL